MKSCKEKTGEEEYAEAFEKWLDNNPNQQLFMTVDRTIEPTRFNIYWNDLPWYKRIYLTIIGKRFDVEKPNFVLRASKETK